MPEPYTLAQLEAQYPDASVRDRIFELAQFRVLLAQCIIAESYKIPEDLFTSIALTEYGLEQYRQLRAKNVGHAEATLMCLLEYCHIDLMIDVEKTDFPALTSSVDRQIKDGRITYPFIYGRLLYDKYADLFANQERGHLSIKETWQLLRSTPQGVFQVLNLITGPFGIVQSAAERYVYPTLSVHLRHCSDVTCSRVHSVLLSTAEDAAINAKRKTFDDLLKRQSEHPSQWGKFIQKIGAKRVAMFSDKAFDAVAYLIGDALTQRELAELTGWLTENSTGDRVRPFLTSLGVGSDARSLSEKLDRAQLMQLVLIADDKSLETALDTLVQRGHISVPHGEVRRPVVNEAASFGRYHVQAELGEYGVRTSATSMPIAPLRARRLVEEMFRLDDLRDRQELEWQLRREPGETLEAKLEHYLQTQPPLEALRTLVLFSRSNVVIACQQLGLIDGSDEDDDSLLMSIAWKLGFSVVDVNDVHAKFWTLHERMLQHARQSPIGRSDAELEEVRGVAASYFAELERVLDDSLAYVTWALTNDHYYSGKPFTYRPDVDRREAFKALNEVGKKRRPEALAYGDRNTLFPLMRGFALLADILFDYQGRADEFRRPGDQAPEWVGVQTLQRFPFNHTVPFLDIVEDCSKTIVDALVQITSALTSSDISTARNEWLHGRRTTADMERLRMGLAKVGEALRMIEETGFSRSRYSWVRSDQDGEGRRTAILASASGREVALFRPSPFAWLRMPSLSDSWYVMHSARFAEPSEVLRFGVELDSPYAQMWRNYPIRPRVSDLDEGLGVSGSAGSGNTAD